MSGPEQQRTGLLEWWWSTMLEVAHETFTVIEQGLAKYLESPKPTRGPIFDKSMPLSSPTRWVSGPLHIDSEAASPVRLHCPGLRQVGGGRPIPADRITFEPPTVTQGQNRVVARVDMTDVGVGIWTGEIVSRHNPSIRLSPNPLMPTWAGGL